MKLKGLIATLICYFILIVGLLIGIEGTMDLVILALSYFWLDILPESFVAINFIKILASCGLMTTILLIMEKYDVFPFPKRHKKNK